MLSHNVSQHADSTHDRGFTVVEFIVIMGIFVIISGISLANFRGFQSNVSISNVAYDMALVFRSAQVSGSASFENLRVTSVGVIQTDDDFATAEDLSERRGIYFRHDGSGYGTEMILFQDSDGGGTPQEFEGADRVLERYSIGRGIILGAICVAPAGLETVTCPDDMTSWAPMTNDVSILYKRPDANAIIKVHGLSDEYALARIALVPEDPDLGPQFLDIWESGQISVP